nr:hypothetical protein [Streptomyces katrae]
MSSVWPRAEDLRRRGAWIVFEDEAGFSMTPPHAKTWSQRGRTPVVRVRGRTRRRISNVAFSTPEHLVQRIRRGLRHIRYRSELLDG